MNEYAMVFISTLLMPFGVFPAWEYHSNTAVDFLLHTVEYMHAFLLGIYLGM